MKIARFLSTVFAFGSLTIGLGYAGEPSRQPDARDPHADSAGALRPAGPERADGSPMEPKHSELKNNGHILERGNPAGPIHPQTKSASLNGPHQPLVKNAAAAKNGRTMHETTNPHEQLAKSPAGNRAVEPRAGVVRTRGSTAANVGRVLISANARYSAGPLAAGAKQHNR